MENNITNNTELRAAVTLLSASVNDMCNTKDRDRAIEDFSRAKDLIIQIFRYNIERLGE